ncbi:PID-CTERM protein-sorting domain-containing protein [Aequorivita vitellina]|uniref:PID-CTERM protein-sorting domain-containing protein n=1 Tax=Aequorivita vitellina TaxID=2874475 RepID=UPI0038B399A3
MLTSIYLFLFLLVQARDDVPPPNPPPPGPQLPIDDSIWILIVAGLIYGLYIIYQKNKSTSKAS